jgi:NAD+ synthase (glutamine-hydrolysing)
MPSLRLALAQLNVTVGDVPGNQRRIEQALRQATAWRADLVAVPELAICGYPPEDLLLKPHFVEECLKALRWLSAASQGLVAIVGCLDRDANGRLYNAAAILADGRRAATYHKQCLPNYGVFDEKRYFAPGAHAQLITVGGIRIGVMICEDLWEPQPIRRLAVAGAQLAINISASPYHAGKLKERERLFARRAREGHAAVAYCNLVGGQDELVFDGASLVLDSRGKRLIQGAQFREDFVVIDLAFPPRGLRRPKRDEAASTVAMPRTLADRPRLPRVSARTLGPVEEVYEALTLGARDYVRKNRFDTVVLGLSGGIDSSLTATIAADALGAEHVVGVVMPSQFSSQATQADARRVARALGLRCEELPIRSILQIYLKTLGPAVGWRPGAPVGLTEQNLQARIRGNLLMALSNRFGWLVLTTGNKSEMATGYTTLYGDMAGGFDVLKDVPKTLVYQLARFRNARGPGAPIPASVFSRPPTAELAPGQRDQQTLPPYPVLDRILKAYVEEDQSLREIQVRNRFAPPTVKRVIQMVDRSEYKRRQGPPGIKITPKAFGKDRRMPITNRYQES